MLACGGVSPDDIELIERGEGGIAGDCIGSDAAVTAGGIFFRHDPSAASTDPVLLIEAAAIVDDADLVTAISGPLISDRATAFTAEGPDENDDFFMGSDPDGSINTDIGLRAPTVDDEGRVLLEPGDGGYIHLSFTIEPSPAARNSLMAIYGWELTYEVDGERYRTVMPSGAQLWFDKPSPCLENISETEDRETSERIFEAQRRGDYGELDRVPARPLPAP
jgi:hypothetical protein